MSGPLGSSQWMYNPSTSFFSTTLDQSLRFNDTDNHYLNRVSTTGDRQKWTWSGWLKRSTLGNINAIFSEGGTGNSFALYFWSDNTILAQARNSSSNRFVHQTSALFRDTSAWYHVVYAHDSTQATDTDRVNLYVNGVEQSIVAVGGNTFYPPLNENVNINNGGNHSTGYAATNSFKCFDGYMAEVHFVDGQQLDATDFGELSNGVWVPKEYSGSYGTNGYRLTFSSNSFTDNASDPDVFADQAGSNNHNAYNFTASDVVSDSPTNNFCTLNPLAYTNGITLSEGNLTMSTTTNNRGVHGTMPIPSSGKWYWELHVDSRQTGGGIYAGFGSDASLGYDEYASTKGIFILLYNQAIDLDGSTQSSPYNSQGNDSVSNGDIFSFALDVDNQKFYVAKNGTYRGSSDPSAGTGGLDVSTVFTNAVTELTVCLTRGGSYNETYSVNFGQDSKDVASANADSNGIGTFEYAVPTGFLALCTSNLPEPTIGPNSATQADDNFNTVLYTGDGTSSNAITGVGFQPDFLWIKQRSDTRGHQLMDSVRGASVRLQSHGGTAESASALVSFDSDGFTVDGSTLNGTNISGGTFVGWSWKGGGTAASNTNGSITSSVSANQDAGFSIVSYTGNATAGATVGHGLSSAPEMIIVKSRSGSTNWTVYHSGTASDPETDYLALDSTNAVADLNTVWNDTAPTSSVFSLGTFARVNAVSETFIAYCFHSVSGYSAVGSYVGNGNADGTFVYTGFRPAWVMWKNASATTVWVIFDAVRETYNYLDAQIRPNEASAENSAGASYSIDFLSNGFKVRSSDSNFNGSGNTIIYLAFAEAPFKYANAR